MTQNNIHDFEDNDVFIEKNLQSRGNFEEFDLDEHRKNLRSPIKSMYESIDGWDHKAKSISIEENNYLEEDVLKDLDKMRMEYCEKKKTLNEMKHEEHSTNRRSSRKSFTTHEYILRDNLSSQDSSETSEGISRDKMKHKLYKAIILEPRVEVASGFAVYKAWVDLSSFRLSLTDLRLYVSQFSNRLLVVEAVERGFKNKVSKSLKKCFRLPRFCDIYDVRHRVDVMGLLKIEVPLIYFAESLTEEEKDSKQETKAFIHTPRKTVSEEINRKRMRSENGWMDNLNGNNQNFNVDSIDEDNYEIIVKLPENQLMANIKVLSQNNIIFITEIISSNASNTKYSSDDNGRKVENDGKIENCELTVREKLRFVKMYKIPRSGLKDAIQCNKIDAKTLKISIPVMD